MAHTEKFRQKVLSAVESGATYTEASKRYKVSANTIAKWKNGKKNYVRTQPSRDDDTALETLRRENVELKLYIFNRFVQDGSLRIALN